MEDGNDQFENSTAMEDIIDNNVVQSVFYIMYTLIFVLGIFGNVLVCYVVLRNKAMQTVTNLFITNLALSDILLCVLAVPFTPLYTFHGKWLFGSAICHLVPVAQGISVYISTLTLTSIAIDRYFVIIYPFQPRMKVSTCIIIIVSIWIFSILVTVPYGINMIYHSSNTTINETDIKYYCEEKWPDDNYRQIYAGITTFLQFVMPFFFIAYCYICVSMKLNDRAKSKPGCKSSKKEEADRERKRRTNRMLIAMVIIFLVSWLPLNMFNIIFDFYRPFMEWPYYYLLFFMVHSLAMSSTCYNPFLYAWLNENFRKEFKHVLPCFDVDRSTNQQRAGNYRSERTCNGNETQSSMLPTSGVHRALSIRERKQTPPPPLKTDSVEVENVMIPNVAAIYDSAAETVRLKLITEEDPPPYDSINSED
ncbi:prolactin-releasing peptide receptor-like [Atheta coriaria]|uniref:prolactin-releasing peptide receptor-like n=1 Tax=Dalotia coriaria TaxID=877792 RepID=UPI0031F43DD8